MARTYTLTPAALLADVRRLVNDSNADLQQRYEDADLVATLNEALRALIVARPDLGSTTAEHICDAGSLQDVGVDRSVGVVDIIGLREVDRATLDDFAPGWRSTDADTAEEWMRVPGSALAFEVFPPAAGGEALPIRVVLSLPIVTTGDLETPIAVPEAYGPSIVEYMVGRIELADDEHANSGRAAALLGRFEASLKAPKV